MVTLVVDSESVVDEAYDAGYREGLEDGVDSLNVHIARQAYAIGRLYADTYRRDYNRDVRRKVREFGIEEAKQRSTWLRRVSDSVAIGDKEDFWKEFFAGFVSVNRR